jgi:hypothetical protein
MNRFTFYSRCTSCAFRSDDYTTPGDAEIVGSRHEYEKSAPRRGASHDTYIVTEDDLDREHQQFRSRLRAINMGENNT